MDSLLAEFLIILLIFYLFFPGCCFQFYPPILFTSFNIEFDYIIIQLKAFLARGVNIFQPPEQIPLHYQTSFTQLVPKSRFCPSPLTQYYFRTTPFCTTQNFNFNSLLINPEEYNVLNHL